MVVRMIEAYFTTSQRNAVERFIEKYKDELVSYTMNDIGNGDGRILLRAVLDAGSTEKLVDRLENTLSWAKEFRVIILPVEATIPRHDPFSSKERKVLGLPMGSNRLSREEIYQDVIVNSRISWTFLLFVFLSAIIGSVGLLRGNIAVIIGAMVIAPFLGPLTGVGLATVMGEFPLAKSSGLAAIVGIVLVITLAMITGMYSDVDLSIMPEIALRADVRLEDVLIALAAGCAGALAITLAMPSAFVGVTVAAALLPPMLSFGLLLGGGYYTEAAGALLLVVANIVCIVTASLAVFMIQGVRPRRWKDAAEARGTVLRAAIILSSMLLIVSLAILLYDIYIT